MRAARLLIPALLAVASAAQAQTASALVSATRDAAVACAAIEQFVLEDCGSRAEFSPAHSKARKAVGSAYRARMTFMAYCSGSVQQCAMQADVLALHGLNEGYNATSVIAGQR